MQYVQFGNANMQVSRFCLGAMMFGKKFDMDGSRQVVDEAIEHGVNFIDTAESYNDSEEFLGRILDGRRDKVYLATKIYTKCANDGHCGRNSRANILYSIERSLKLLKTDHVDLYQLHHPDIETPIDETLETLHQIVKEGKTRYVGVSNHYAWQMAYMIAQAQCRAWEPIVSIQCSYSIVDRPAEVETVPMAQRFNLAMMNYGPLRGGVLTGKYRRGDDVPEGSRAHRDKKLQRLLARPKVWDLLDKLREIARRSELQMSQLAILWLLSKNYVTTPILGGSKPEHFRMIYEIADRKLSEEDVREIDDVSRDFVFKPFVNQPVQAGSGLPDPW